jgi:hypothetical protein
MRIRDWGPLRLLATAPEEVWFFLRIAAYAIFIGTVYWFVSYEAAGTMLLYGFGIAAGFGTLILLFGARGRRRTGEPSPEPGTEPGLEPDGPFGDESGRIPSPTLAPFAVGLGAALLGVGLILGPWLIGLGLIVFAWGGLDWLFAAGREYRAVDGSDVARAAPVGSTGGVPRAAEPSTSDAAPPAQPAPRTIPR